MLYLCTAKQKRGLVVQLVRIHACHAWGRGFESRPDRQKFSCVVLCNIWFYTGLFKPMKGFPMEGFFYR